MPEEIQQQTTDETETTETATQSTTDVQDNTNLLKALQAERDRAKKLEQEAKSAKLQLKAFENVDPELAKQAKEILAKQEEQMQWQSQREEEIRNQYEPKIAEYQRKVEAAEQQLQNYKIDVMLERAFYNTGGFEGEFEPVAPALRRRVKLDPQSGNLKILDAKGQPMFVKGEPAKLEDLIEDLKTNEIWVARHFRSKEPSGAGLNGGSSMYSGHPRLEGLSEWEQVAALRNMQGKA